MLSCSLDPDQDLQSGSKLFTWYVVCCNIGGGGGYVLVVKFSGGDYVLVVKFSGGGLCPSCKIHGGDFVHVYKKEQGGFCPGGILSYTLNIHQKGGSSAATHFAATKHIINIQCGYVNAFKASIRRPHHVQRSCQSLF